MKKVYFTSISDSDGIDVRIKKFSHLLDKTAMFDFIHENDKVAVKLHFGEDGNTGYVDPKYAGLAVKHIVNRGGNPTITDSNVLYRGMRTFTKDHLETASKHGFTQKTVGAPVVIADGLDGNDVTDIKINQRFVKVAKIASLFCRVDAVIGIAHFKGHLLTGFGGALKNIGMGCASREGKLAQHSDVSPLTTPETCTGCEECMKSCPVSAISMIENKAAINDEKCIGCAECIASCSFGAITVDWHSGADKVQERMAEYAKAALAGKEEKKLFINFAVKISSECDCWPKDYPAISPDVGIFISHDPVAVDKASFDSVIAASGRDVFRQAHPEIDGMKQLQYAVSIGLGNMEYDLITVS